MRFHNFLLTLFIVLGLTSAASAQSFQLFVQDQNSNTTPIANGATITLAANALNQTTTVTLLARYTGINTASLNGPAQIVGSSAFTFSTVPTATTLNPGDTFSMTIAYTAASSTQASAQVIIPTTEMNANGVVTSAGSIAVSVLGTAPKFAVSYFLQSDQNIVALADGGTLTFPSTAVSTTSSAGLIVQNVGSGPGTINKVTVTGAAFTVVGLPLLPGGISVNAALQFTVRYTPTQSQTDTGTLQIVYPDRTVTINLTGSGITSAYTYQLLQNGQTTTITPGQPFAVADVNVGKSGSFSITVQNAGNASGTVAGVGLAGTGFLLTDAPFFPQTLLPNAFFTLTFAFTPPQPGPFKAQLRIGNDTFTVTANGIGPQLTFSYSAGSGSTTVPSNGAVVFSPVQIGSTSSVTFSIMNTGTATGNVSSISIGQPKSPFALTGLPAFPLTLAPNASASFTVQFTPAAAATNSATLLIDTQLVNLTGAGIAPAPIPAYQFVGAGGTQPLQQLSIGLTLASPYSQALTGILTMVETPDGFSADPSVQFGTGGLTVAFTIPANTQQAVFSNGATNIKLQTGSVSGTITITPTFATTGGYDLTPPNQTTAQLTIPAAAPQVIGVQVTSTATTGFTIQVNGLATSRKLTKLNVVITPAASFNLSTASFTTDITSVAGAWFQSNQSSTFGGQFALTVPFTLSPATAPGGTNPIQSVTVSLTNDLGTSSPVTAQLQ